MTTPRDAEAARTRQPGRLSRALIRMWMKRARVIETESVAEGFHLITLESPEFRGIAWSPGQKVQIAMGSAFATRTFTPMEWDGTAGRTRILSYAHGDGPGSEWLRCAKHGDECDIFGPRASLDVGAATQPLVLFGDETSIGLAHAIPWRQPDRKPHVLLEVNAVADARQALARLNLDDAELFERARGDTHLQEIERRLPAFADATLILTGKASSIQRLRQTVKGLGIPAARLAAKAYWATGKVGLD